MDPSAEDLLAQVRATAEGYQVFGELGRKSEDDIWFLAREEGKEPLVALRLKREPVPGGEPVLSLEVAKELGPNVSMGEGDCWKCQGKLRSFARFCGRCGADQTKGTRVAASDAERQAFLQEVKVAAGDHYDVLGEMSWQGLAGGVYFAIERARNELVRLRLRPGDDGMELGETTVAMSLSGSLTAAYMTQPGVPAPPLIIRRRESGPRPAPERSSGKDRVIDLPAAPPPAPSPRPLDRPVGSTAKPAARKDRERILLSAVIVLGVVVVILIALVIKK